MFSYRHCIYLFQICLFIVTTFSTFANFIFAGGEQFCIKTLNFCLHNQFCEQPLTFIENTLHVVCVQLKVTFLFTRGLNRQLLTSQFRVFMTVQVGIVRSQVMQIAPPIIPTGMNIRSDLSKGQESQKYELSTTISGLEMSDLILSKFYMYTIKHCGVLSHYAQKSMNVINIQWEYVNCVY